MPGSAWANTMEFTETNRADLSGDLQSRVQGLLKQAFPGSACEHRDYYTIYGTPAVIVILREGREVIGHLAAYRREVEIGCEPLEIGMVGGVAIAPNHRGRGHSRALVRRAHAYLKKRSIPFSILFAREPRVYASSGYKLMRNETHFLDIDHDWKTYIYRGSMYAELSQRPWPNQIVNLRGPVV
jgi:predicted acetyltransferase